MKKKRVVISVVSVAIASVLLFSVWFYFTSTDRYFLPKIENNEAENYYNNTEANQSSGAVKINDTIFFHFHEKTGEKSGTYIISGGSAHRISKESINFDCVYDKKLYYFDEDSNLYYLDINGKKHMEQNIKVPSELKRWRMFSCEDTLFLQTDSSVYHYKSGSFEKFVDYEDLKLGRNDFYYYFCTYIYGNDFYYCYHENNKTHFCKFDTVKKQTDFEVELNINDVSSVLVDNKNIYFIVGDDEHSKLYSINKQTKTSELLFSTEGFLIVNLYNGKIIVGVRSGKESGVYMVESAQKSKKLSSKEPVTVYSFDDNYVYFTDMNYRLIRINLENSMQEVVFR